jgi:hypothetical protein
MVRFRKHFVHVVKTLLNNRTYIFIRLCNTPYLEDCNTPYLEDYAIRHALIRLFLSMNMISEF